MVSFLVKLLPTDTDNKLVNGDCKVLEMVKLLLYNPFPEQLNHHQYLNYQ